MSRLQEWQEQLKLVFEKKTSDALIPPVLFFLINQWLSLEIASLVTFIYLVGLIVYRKVKQDPGKYAYVGVVGVLLSIGLSLLSGEAIDFYLPDLITTGGIVLICFGSLVIHRPIAALLSHLTRGWPLDWYKRQDIAPAYKYATIIWGSYFLFRLIVQSYFYFTDQFSSYFFFNTLLGMPMTIVMLIGSYVVGVKTLKKLNGPSVEEFNNGDTPPYEGQKHGF